VSESIRSSNTSDMKQVVSRGTSTSPAVGARCVKSSGSSFSTASNYYISFQNIQLIRYSNEVSVLNP
jgi:hypothetical protein